MGLFDKILKKAPSPGSQAAGTFKTFTAYQPVFTTWGGQLYENELVRSAIDARARHISKLQFRMEGSAKPKLKTRMMQAPNSFQTWSQFLYRTSTILDMQNTAFIVPVFGDFGEITGYYPVLPSRCTIVEYNGEPWLRYEFSNGEVASVELKYCGILTKHQYDDDFFGADNTALNDTMDLIVMQSQGIKEAVKNSNTFRFMAKLINFSRSEDLAKERKRFSSENLSGGDGGGILLFPNTYTDIKQLTANSYTVDPVQMEQIKTNVFNYFGVNDKVLQNSALGDDLDAFFNGAIEPFEIQFSDVMTKCIFTSGEISNGNKVMLTANRLQYMSTKTKVLMAQQMGDRGMLLINEARELFNLPPIPGGDVAPVRGEYKPNTALSETTSIKDGDENAE